MLESPQPETFTFRLGNGHTVTFEYDHLGRTKTATYSDGTVLSYAYTGDGQLHSVTETKGENVTVYVYQYDTLGNLVGSEKFSDDLPVLRTWHSYNNDNRLSSQGWQIGADSFSQTYAYDTWDGNLSSIVLDGTTFRYTYDDLRRLDTVSNGVFTSRYSYWDDEEAGTASPRLKSIVHEGVNYSGKTVECNYTYEYDVNGNITAVAFGNRRQTYVYDDNNQLIRENNDRRQYTQTWEYDEFGNITATRKYAYTTEELGEPTSTVTYDYTDSDWGDLLTQYNGQTIEYDEIGNPLFVKNGDTVVKSYTWSKGRQLATHMTKGVTWNYSYDISGLRTQRTNGTTTYEYIYAGDKLVRMVKNGEVVDFGYAGGQLATMTYDGVTYYYILNGQGDVLGLTDSTGKMVIGYIYSAYGIPTPLKADETLTPILKNLNPFMYRGYVYDIESGLYYLQSRYYDPEMGRFINADSYASTGQGVLGNNMFAYCGNNPIINVDANGSKSIWFYLIQVFRFGFVHMCVEAHIYSKYASAGVEVELWLEESGKLVGRADVMKGNQVWEIKHGGSDDLTEASRTTTAAKQAKGYIGKTAIRTSTTVEQLGEANAFEGNFTVTVRDSSYSVKYSTPAEGAIIYIIEEIEYQENADFELLPVKNGHKTTVDVVNVMQYTVPAVMFAGCAYVAFACYNDSAITRVRNGLR